MDCVRKTSRAIDSVVDMIPARFYLSNDTLQKIQELDVNTFQSLGNKFPNSKYKPTGAPIDCITKTTTLLRIIGQKENKVKKKNKKRMKRQKTSEKNNSCEKLESNQTTNISKSNSNTNPIDSNRETLRERLRNKIANMQEQKKINQRAADAKRLAEKRERQLLEKSKNQSKQENNYQNNLKEDLDFGNQKLDKKQIDTQYIAPQKGSKIKNIEKAIRDVERGGSEVKQQDDESRFSKAEQKLTGVVIKDDLQKLKKSKQMILQKKQESRKNWAAKETQKNEGMRKKLDKREEHLNNRLNKQANARKKARKGFEGQGEVFPKRNLEY